MADATAILELPAVRILTAMAPGTVLRQRLGSHDCCVTGVTVDLRVCTVQREFGLATVVVSDGMPFLIIVAIVALGAEPRGVRIVGSVATVAVLGNLILVVTATVAGQTIDVGVNAEERVAGFLEMVVLGSLPFLGDVAFATVGATRPAMLIVGGMTAQARLRS